MWGGEGWEGCGVPFLFSALDALWEGGGDVRVYENCGRSEGGHSDISKG